MSWRLVTDDGAGAAAGLALDEALMSSHARTRENRNAATLRLYTYRSHCALVGRYQSLADEVDLDACERLGVQVGRRPTGGGAIIMGADQLGVAVVTRAPAEQSPRETLRRYAGGLIAGLATLGIEAAFRAKNDLEADGRKIAGLGLYLDADGALLFHASVLAGLDVELMLEVLNIPGAKLAGHGLTRVSERVTTASEQTGTPLQGADLRQAIADGFAAALGVELRPADPDEDELALAGLLAREKYTAAHWLEQRNPRRDAEGSAVLRTPEGLVRVYAGVHGDAIKSVMVAGDFNVLPPEIGLLEAELRWCPARPDRVEQAVRRAVGGDGPVLGLDCAALAAGIWAAAERALERDRSAHPVRPTGSCYAPDAGAAPAAAPIPMEAA